jgi:hypothetical protein
MNRFSIAQRFTTLTAVASIFAAAALASMPALADTIPAATRAEVRAELARAQAAGELEPAARWGVQTAAPVARTSNAQIAAPQGKTAQPVEAKSGLTRAEVRAELERARANGEVQLGGYSGYFFEPPQARGRGRTAQDTRAAE